MELMRHRCARINSCKHAIARIKCPNKWIESDNSENVNKITPTRIENTINKRNESIKWQLNCWVFVSVVVVVVWARARRNSNLNFKSNQKKIKRQNCVIISTAIDIEWHLYCEQPSSSKKKTQNSLTYKLWTKNEHFQMIANANEPKRTLECVTFVVVLAHWCSRSRSEQNN